MKAKNLKEKIYFQNFLSDTFSRTRAEKILAVAGLEISATLKNDFTILH